MQEGSADIPFFLEDLFCSRLICVALRTEVCAKVDVCSAKDPSRQAAKEMSGWLHGGTRGRSAGTRRFSPRAVDSARERQSLQDGGNDVRSTFCVCWPRAGASAFMVADQRGSPRLSGFLVVLVCGCRLGHYCTKAITLCPQPLKFGLLRGAGPAAEERGQGRSATLPARSRQL